MAACRCNSAVCRNQQLSSASWFKARNGTRVMWTDMAVMSMDSSPTPCTTYAVGLNRKYWKRSGACGTMRLVQIRNKELDHGEAF
jgi:hypothetical protein